VPECWELSAGTQEYKQFIRAYTMWNYFPQMVDSPDCVTQTFTRKYWYAFSAILGAVAVALFF
jgi:hypothetical protein